MNKHVYGLDDPGAAIRALTEVVTRQNLEINGMKFRDTHEDYKPSADNVAAMESVMNRFNLQPSEEGLHVAWELVKTSRNSGNPTPAAESEPAPAAPRRVAPPRVSRTSTAPAETGDSEDAFENMSLDEMRALDARLRARGR
jgi:hypothetical protein